MLLKGDYLITSPSVGQFERKVARYVTAKYAVALGDETAALHMACHAAGFFYLQI